MKAAVAAKAQEIALAPGTSIISSENIVYLMGLSFIIGSLFTIFILIVLDFMKRDRKSKEPS
jgi:hypothetical protein